MPASVNEATINAAAAGVTTREQWICWREETRDGEPTKVPIKPFDPGSSGDPHASHSDPSTWGDFKTALACHQADTTRTDGIGYVFAADGPLVGIDLDDCRDPSTGELADWAHDIVTRLDSYTEISPSGTGLHVLVRGDLPPGGRRHGHVEMYDETRFFTVTGAHLDQTPLTIHERQDILAAVHDEYIQSQTQSGGRRGDRDADSDILDDSWVDDLPEDVPAPDEVGTQPTGGTTDAAHAQQQVSEFSDKELVKRAKAADDGGKFDSLWAGRWQATSAPSQSEADMMLACKLAFWTGGDPQRMDRIFRQSGLMRDKWDEVHYASGETYGEKCLTRAVQQISDFYTPHGTDDDDHAATTAAADPDPTGGATTNTTTTSTSAPSDAGTAGVAASTENTSASNEGTAGSTTPTGSIPERGTDGVTAGGDDGRDAATTDAASQADATPAAADTGTETETETETESAEAALAEKDARIEELEDRLERKRQRISVLQDKVKEFRAKYRAATTDESTEIDPDTSTDTDTDAETTASHPTDDTGGDDADRDDGDGPVSWLRDRFS